MAWSIQGRYFENCSCEVVCPCTASLALGADNDYCRFALVFHVDQGEVDGVDVSDLTVTAIAESGRYMHEGNWKLGVLLDEAASDEQAEKLGAVFGGQMGGPMEALAPLVGEQLGVERGLAVGDRTQDGGDGEQPGPGEEDPPAAQQVGGAAAEHEESGEGQRVRVDHPLQPGRRVVQVVADRGQGDVHDGDVEHHHELGQADDQQEQVAADGSGERHGRRSP